MAAAHRPHVLVVPYPSQGHINPLLQLCKRLVSHGLTVTFATTLFILNTFTPKLPPSIHLDTISDGFDTAGYEESSGVDDYLARLQTAGSNTLADLIQRHQHSSNPVHCVIYDSFLSWALDVANKFGLPGGPFFTQASTCNYIYYCIHHGLLKLPIPSFPVSVQGLQFLSSHRDMPSFVGVPGSYPAYFRLVLSQLSNVHQANFVLVNSVYEFEQQVVDSMSKVCPVLTIGPTVPLFYLDKSFEEDKEYGYDLFEPDSSAPIIQWLDTKPAQSVVYVAFGSMANLSASQMEELALGLKATTFNFLWVVRTSKERATLPPKFAEEIGDRGLILNWGPQMEILSHGAVGCFFTHGGWNSTVEALSLGVPMVGMPQWTDQPTDAKLIEDMWKVGVRVKVDENGIVGRNEVENCIREVMEGETSSQLRHNAKKWRNVALQAITEGGSSHTNICQLVSKLLDNNFTK
ncbi:UDP-glycosyltransferase 74F2-like [Humulus lupulus]|uniref:UDP-glycosyltransferase 74F2-like n=1 Tax=Humulus lupulus TaxID=3486 RepID=UPI002B400F2C|nr:UDP-glycosyltransferase 74F2-like [Humulus lupulus]